MSLAGKACVVTGGGRGIGRATALRLCTAGAHVLVGSRTARELEETVRLCMAGPGACAFQVTDLAKPREIEAMVNRARSEFGRVDALINNAGVAPLSPVGEMADEAFDQLVAVNISAVFYACRAVWPALKETKGTIVNVSSIAADDPFPGFAAYGGTKAFVNIFSQALAAEGRPHGIQVFVIAPGAVETPLLRSLFPDFPAKNTLDADAIAREIVSLIDGSSPRQSGDIIRLKK